MNFNEYKYKSKPTAQSRLAKILQRNGKRTAMSVEREEISPQNIPMPMLVRF